MTRRTDDAALRMATANGARLFSDGDETEAARAARSWARALLRERDPVVPTAEALLTLHSAVLFACAEVARATGEDPEVVYRRIMARS